jgi:hypothetical protein
VTVESQQPWPDGATAVAHVADPALTDHTVTLQQTSATTFVGSIPAAAAGTYAVGATVSAPSGRLLSGTTVATQSFSAEYLPGQPDPAALARVSRLAGGRGAIAPGAAFDGAGLPAGRGLIPLTGWLLLVAALLWPLVVALGRLALNGAGAAAWSRAMAVGRGVGKRGRGIGGRRPVPFRRSSGHPGAEARAGSEPKVPAGVGAAGAARMARTAAASARTKGAAATVANGAAGSGEAGARDSGATGAAAAAGAGGGAGAIGATGSPGGGATDGEAAGKRDSGHATGDADGVLEPPATISRLLQRKLEGRRPRGDV